MSIKWPHTPALSSYARMRMTENQLLGALDPRRQFDVKVRFPPSEKVGFICLNGSPLMMKNAFYFNLKAPFFLIIFKFYLEFFGQKNVLLRESRFISKL